MIETFRGIAHPSLCDSLGHLNTRSYFNVFDDASFRFFDALGEPCDVLQAQQQSWADIKAEIEYKAEIPLGRAFFVRTGIVALGGRSVTFRHEMMSGESAGMLHATMQAVSVFFDLAARKAIALPESFRREAERHMVGMNGG